MNGQAEGDTCLPVTLTTPTAGIRPKREEHAEERDDLEAYVQHATDKLNAAITEVLTFDADNKDTLEKHQHTERDMPCFLPFRVALARLQTFFP